jgi:nitroimidazol reductase NimA-like FMN-containing flavoprotein (pyridoxamine 5'-phosphate oxidase superfamily)
VHFDAAEHCLYSFPTAGQKIDWMRQNPQVCVEVDDIADQFHWTTVLIFGRYQEISTLGDQTAVRRRAEELFRRHSDWWLPGAGKLTPGAEHGEPVVYRVGIDRMSGRRAARGST